MTRFNLYKDGKFKGFYETKKEKEEIIDEIIRRKGITEAIRYDVEVIDGVPVSEAEEWK